MENNDSYINELATWVMRNVLLTDFLTLITKHAKRAQAKVLDPWTLNVHIIMLLYLVLYSEAKVKSVHHTLCCQFVNNTSQTAELQAIMVSKLIFNLRPNVLS